MIYKIPVIKIEPYGLVITNDIYCDSDNYYKKYYRFENIKENRIPDYTNFSLQARKRLKRAFHLLLAISEKQHVYDPMTRKTTHFTLNFITLTLSAKQGIHTDYTIKHLLLNDFLTRLRQQQNLKHYIWKSETQKNGNLHFHIISNKYFNYQYIRDVWNSVQKKLGYIDLFNEKHHHINPNSTDVKGIYNIENSSAYIRKYISKIESEYRNVNGKVWDCSQSLKPKYTCRITCTGNNLDILQELEERERENTLIGDYYKFIPIRNNNIESILPTEWIEEYNKYLQNILEGKKKNEIYQEIIH